MILRLVGQILFNRHRVWRSSGLVGFLRLVGWSTGSFPSLLFGSCLLAPKCSRSGGGLFLDTGVPLSTERALVMRPATLGCTLSLCNRQIRSISVRSNTWSGGFNERGAFTSGASSTGGLDGCCGCDCGNDCGCVCGSTGDGCCSCCLCCGSAAEASLLGLRCG